ncbi:hypothetical protein BJ508DRAFT_412913 [Ascobolus immersus RN42]|uniref:Uncharacterized protein n=1 Tax=Ascobolus immersus RN42 TaxID=1160509 RepID=A0A3N4IFJ7_ASCIM|nr:hypothetical protein BJ508DRAFT_412913 [Ascobolus immersus RN42]
MKLSLLFAIAAAGFVSTTFAFPAPIEVEVEAVQPVELSNATSAGEISSTTSNVNPAHVESGSDDAEVVAVDYHLITACHDANYKNCFKIYGYLDNCLNLNGDQNDAITSIDNSRGVFWTYDCRFYEHQNCAGNNLFIGAGSYLTNVGPTWNDQLSSVLCTAEGK